MTRSKVDANQAEIVADLRRLGCLVAHTHTLRGGKPDILVGHRGLLFWLEIKAARGTLTADEQRFHDEWSSYPVFVVRSAEQAVAHMDAWIEVHCVACCFYGVKRSPWPRDGGLRGVCLGGNPDFIGYPAFILPLDNLWNIHIIEA